MNFSPYNNYNGYNYGAYQQFPQQMQPAYQNQQYPIYQQGVSQQTSQSQLQPQILNGKIVDGIDTVKIQEVPIGGYGVYPKADLSTIYVKEWLNDGTTKIVSYYPSNDDNSSVTKDKNNYENKLNEIYSLIGDLNNKIDTFLA